MSLAQSPRIRDVAVEKLTNRITEETYALSHGFGADYADYRYRCGVIAGLEQAIVEINFAVQLVTGNKT